MWKKVSAYLKGGEICAGKERDSYALADREFKGAPMGGILRSVGETFEDAHKI